MNKKKHFVLVDFDGTLLNSVPSLFKAYCEFMNHLGTQGTQTEFDQLNGVTLSDAIDILIEKHNVANPTPELKEKYREALKKHYLGSKLFEDAPYFFKTLKENHIEMILVTSGSKTSCGYFLDKFDIRKLFYGLIFENDVENTKPDPEPYLKGTAIANQPAGNLIAIEDSILGVTSASKAGNHVFALDTSFEVEKLTQAGAVLTKSSLTELLPEILKFFNLYEKNPNE